MKENIDPVYGYIDKQVKSVKKSQTEDLKIVTEAILNTQRQVASLMVNFAHFQSQIAISDKFPTQFVVEFTTAYGKIQTADTPLEIANKFVAKRWDDLEHMGVKTVTVQP